ncbi:MAG: malonic semialdehyde reductase [Candidatus Adiutrix sp.]|jgi:nitroreductase|nr:malonic semialdehyde reductase [Candidatus Adiutrix sp.]
MKNSLNQAALDQLFLTARTFNNFTDRPVAGETLHALYDLLKWGPTAVNCQSGRYVFIQSSEGRNRLRPALMPGNVAKVDGAPVTVIVATDRWFYEYLRGQWTAYDAQKGFAENQELAAATGFRNGSLAGAYLILAARALGLDCGPMSGFDNAKVDAEFFPDGRWGSNFLVNLGYGQEGGFYPRGPRLTFEETCLVV